MTAADIELERRVQADLVRGLYAQAPTAIFIGMLGATLVVAALWASAGAAAMLAWFGVYAVNQLVRFAMWRRFTREPADLPRATTWAKRYAWSMFVGGAIFGSPAILFFPPDDPLRQMFIVIGIYGMVSGSTTANAYYVPAIFAYLIPMVVPVAVRMAMEGGLIYGLLAFAVAYTLPIMILLGFRQARLLRDSIRIRHEKAHLIEELEKQKALAEAARQHAEQTSLAKSQFFAAASHDLRQPLQALGLYAASFRQAEREPADARNIEQILASVEALESLFDELLDISKLDAGYVQPNLSHFPGRAVFDRLQATFAPVAHKQGLTLEFRGGDAVLHSDPVLLERVLGNLVSNALRYTESGGVTVSSRRAGETVTLEVADTGIGIPVEQHQRIFDEFYQLGNPGRNRKRGLGLGLATVRRITQLLGCPLKLDSAPGAGSTFRLEARAGDAARVAGAPPVPAPVNVNALSGRLVVVIEDDDNVREGLVQLLGSWHCEVAAAPTATEAIARLAQAPHAILADYRLRDHETGVAAIAALRRHFGTAIPAVLMTGDTAPEIFAAAVEHRLPMLTKPVRAARLRAALTSLLGPVRAAA